MNSVSLILVVVCIITVCRLFRTIYKLQRIIEQRGEGMKALWIEIEHLKGAAWGPKPEEETKDEEG